MDAWYKVATPRKEIREGRSFNPDEFAIALEQVVAGTAPEDYRDPVQFFARTSFTRALREHACLVLRRLAGQTDNTAPVMTLITQFGGGKTHTLTALYHLAQAGPVATSFPGVADVLKECGLSEVPAARVGVFVGNAWDPTDGHETPWIDIARQLAGDAGVEALGNAALTTPPGTDAIARLFSAANAPVLLLFDEVLNFLNRHRRMAESFHAFIQNLTVATTGRTNAACVISLPRSQVEMTAWDQEWQDRISKVVRRVAKDLIVNDEAEISEVVRRRLFEDLGPQKVRASVAREFGDWCFDRRAQLPPEWTAVDSTITDAKAREQLRRRFEDCYPFHPATLSVFHRKWQALPQYQQTRGTLAMLAQWIAWAYRTGFTEARREPLITLGSAPLGETSFRSVVLGQIGEARLMTAIDSDIAGQNAHARALDADTKGPLRGIHGRVGTVIFFESSGGQTEKVAHLPELRFALGEPDVDTTSIDVAAGALENRSYFIRAVGSDGFRIGYQPTVKKVVNDRRASLDLDGEIRPAMTRLVEEEFRRSASAAVEPLKDDPSEIPDRPRLTIVVVGPELEWTADAALRRRVAEWTSGAPTRRRLYPASLVWCLKKPGRDLREKVELMLAWRRVAREVAEGGLGAEFGRSERAEVQASVREAEDAAKDEVWAAYRFAVIADSTAPDAIRAIDLGAGHSSSGESLTGRVLSALKSQALLSDTVAAGYLDRNWPPALREAGAWPLGGLRQSFLDGSLTRLLEPDAILRAKIPEFVARGEFGLGSRAKGTSDFQRVWFNEAVQAEEIAFDDSVFLLQKRTAAGLKSAATTPFGPPVPEPLPPAVPMPPVAPGMPRTIRVAGTVPPELWNRLGTRLLPKLRAGSSLRVDVQFAAVFPEDAAADVLADVRRAVEELGIERTLTVSDET